jgi:serine/threonine-protein kinase
MRETMRKRYFNEDYAAPGYMLTVPPSDGGTAVAYQLKTKLGEGNTAVVYRALQIECGREVGPEVAVKFYNPWDIDDGGLPQELNLPRFIREFESIRHINHPNVIRVLHASRITGALGSSEPAPFIVMELLTGGSLEKQLVANPGRYAADLPTALGLFRRMAAGLAVIHSFDIIHRDFKPANVMFRDGTPVIVDFGFNLPLRGERLTKRGEFLGTLEYASPEQLAASGLVTKKTDIYSFGVVMFQLLTGRNPHPFEAGTNPTDYMATRTTPGRIDPLEFGDAAQGSLVALCTACLSKLADLRPNAEMLVTKLDAMAGPA